MLFLLLLLKLRLFRFIAMLIILISLILNISTVMKQFLQNNWKKVLCVLLFLVLALSLIILVRRTADRSIIIGHPDNIIVISPEESQDVIVIGDPESIKVKPKNIK